MDTQQPETKLQPDTKLHGVQFLRALGMGLVLLGHAIQVLFDDIGQGDSVVARVFGAIVMNGEWVLDQFFVLSGFIMVYVCRDSFGAKGARSEFLRRRITRIVPIYWFYTTVMVVGVWAFLRFTGEGGGFAMSDIVKSYLFIPYIPFFDGVIEPGTQPMPVLFVGWTLVFEMLFYALFAVFVGFTLRRAVWLFAGLVAVLLTVHMFVPDYMVALYYWTSPQLIKFLTGVLIGYAFLRGVFFKVHAGWMFVGMVCAALLNGLWYYLYAGTYMNDMGFHVVAAMLCAIVTGGAVLTSFRLVEMPRWVLVMGDASYSVYLSHTFVLMACLLISNIVFSFNVVVFSIGFIAFSVLASLYAGYLSYRYIELPMTHYTRKKLKVGA